MDNKMKAGDLRVEVEQERVLWYDRKRIPVLGLPWSFIKYELTPSKLIVGNGFFTTREDEVKLYRITDIVYTQSIFERICKTGTITVLSNDKSTPTLFLKHIKNARIVKEAISKAVDDARRKNNVRTSEMVGVDHDCEHHD